MVALAQGVRSALTDIKDQRLVRHFSYIGGKWTNATNGATFPVTDPATGDTLGDVASLSSEESARAVDEAHKAFPSWAAAAPQARAAILRRWFDLMVENREDLARIMVLEQGKPLSEARGEIDYAASFLEYFSEQARRANDIEGVTSHLPDAAMTLSREPLGVAALVTPWNFPAAMLTRKAGAALAAGCTAVAHPSSETPFSAMALAELAERAGMPAGVLNVVTGHASAVVAPWVGDARVRVLSFTGSTRIGRLLYSQSAVTVKRLVMELGGHAPLIVFADADLDQAVTEAIKAKFATSGQDCLAANRIFVERSVYARFCKAFAEKTAALSVGPGLTDPDIGPLMNEGAVAKQEEHVRDAIDRGAQLLCGGGGHPAGKLFFQPTVLADVPQDAAIMREETFGPVAPISPFDEEAEVIARANDTEYGLVAYLHTGDAERAERVSCALEYGMVAINRTKITGAPVPFGGVKQSGLGREGSRYGLEAFTTIKYVCRNMK